MGVMSNLIVDGSAQVRGLVKDVFLEIAGNNNLSEVETMFKKGSSRDAWDKWNYIIDREIEQEKRKRL